MNGVGSLMKQIHDENQFKMPPVGLTEARARVGMEVRMQYTIRCGANNCWFVGHATNKPDARTLLDEHKCPHPPYRNELPTGYSILEKCWDELDDATAALIEGREYNGMSGPDLKGFAKGIAFMLTMMAHPHFKTIAEIAAEAKARYQMQRDIIPYRPTPSYRYNPLPQPSAPNLGRTEPAVKRTTTKSSRGRVTSVQLSSDKIAAIKAASASGMFSPDDIAKMYGVTAHDIRTVVDAPAP